ncbi:hypothetical protein D3C73_1333760 [compost metagenome]
MARTAGARRGVGNAARLRAHLGQKGVQCLHGQGGTHHQYCRADRYRTHWRERAQGVKFDAIAVQGGDHGVVGCTHQQRVAVRRGFGHGFGGKNGVGARLVFHHEALAQCLRGIGGEGARNDVGRSAGGKADDDTHRAFRVLRKGRVGA